MQQSHQHTTEEILLQVSVTKQQTEAGEKSVLNERGFTINWSARCGVLIRM